MRALKLVPTIWSYGQRMTASVAAGQAIESLPRVHATFGQIDLPLRSHFRPVRTSPRRAHHTRHLIIPMATRAREVNVRTLIRHGIDISVTPAARSAHDALPTR